MEKAERNLGSIPIRNRRPTNSIGGNFAAFDFEPLPHFTGEAWQGGPDWPDAKLGWVQLTGDGGHAGNDLRHAAVRRWVVPQDSVVSVSGTLKHEHKEGDGIRGRIVSSQWGVLGDWTVHQDKQQTVIDSVEVKRADTIDFVVDCRGGPDSDSFLWAPTLKWLAPSADAAGALTKTWDAKEDFSGPKEFPKPLDAWEKFAQVLLLSNELMFVD